MEDLHVDKEATLTNMSKRWLDCIWHLLQRQFQKWFTDRCRWMLWNYNLLLICALLLHSPEEEFYKAVVTPYQKLHLIRKTD